MTEHVEGNWKEFTFEIATLAHKEELTQHVRDCFLRAEAMNSYLDWEENNAKDYSTMVGIALKHDCSILVRDTATSELAGFQMVIDTRLPALATQLKVTSTNSTKILGFIHQLEAKTSDCFQRHFKCDFYADVFITSVAPKYQQRGLATELYARMIPFLRSKGFSVLRSTFTSRGTRAIGFKFGFMEIGRMYFQDAVDENGEKLFPRAGDGDQEYASEVACAL